MAAWYFLIFILAIPSCPVAGQSFSKFGLKGGNVVLKGDITGHPDGILWKLKGNKVAEFNGKEQQVFGSYVNRITLNWVTAELTITDLRLEDSGEYELEVDIKNVLQTSHVALKVMDKVSKPTISCTMIDAGSLKPSGELLCSVEPPSSLRFEWTARGKLGPQLQIPLGDKHDDEVYSCSVSNQLSSEATTFTAKDCYPEESSSAAPITTAVIIIALVLLSTLCLVTYWLKRHNKACFEEEDLEKQSPRGSKEEPKEGIPKGGNVENIKKRLFGSKEPEKPNTGHVEDWKKRHGQLGDADVVRPKKPPQEKDPLINQSDSEEENDPEPASVSEDIDDHHGGDADVVLPKESSQEKVPLINQSESKDENDPEPADIDDHHGGDADVVLPKESSQEKVPLINQSDSEEENDPEPAGVSVHVREDKEFSPERPESAKHPEPKGAEQEETPNNDAAKEAEAQSAPRVDSSPAARSHSPSTKDPAGEQKAVANSGQVTGESAQNTAGESDSSGERKRNESNNCGEDTPTSTDPEQRGSRASMEPEENNTSKESQREKVGPGEDRSKKNAGDHEETANSQQPQSPGTKPDHSNTDTRPESSDAARAQPEEEEERETRPDSHDTGGQSDEGDGKSVKK